MVSNINQRKQALAQGSRRFEKVEVQGGGIFEIVEVEIVGDLR